MKTYVNIIFCTIMLVFISSCQKNIDSFIPDNFQGNIDTVWQNNLSSNASVISLKKDLRGLRDRDSFSYANTGSILSSGNLTLRIPINTLVKDNGLIPVGIVQKESSLSLKKGDFIAMGIPTSSNERLLVSGGAFFLNLKNNGENLLVNQGKILTVKFDATNLLQNNRIFNASPDSANGFNWVINHDTGFNKSVITNTGYEILTNRLNYVLTAQYMDTIGIAQTTLSVKLPSNYTNSNTTCYVVFNNVACVGSLKPDVASRTFVSPPLPINKPVMIVVISKQSGDYYLGTFQVTTSINGPSSNVLVTPIKKSLDFIKTYLNTL